MFSTQRILSITTFSSFLFSGNRYAKIEVTPKRSFTQFTSHKKDDHQKNKPDNDKNSSAGTHSNNVMDPKKSGVEVVSGSPSDPILASGSPKHQKYHKIIEQHYHNAHVPVGFYVSSITVPSPPYSSSVDPNAQ